MLLKRLLAALVLSAPLLAAGCSESAPPPAASGPDMKIGKGGKSRGLPAPPPIEPAVK